MSIPLETTNRKVLSAPARGRQAAQRGRLGWLVKIVFGVGVCAAVGLWWVANSNPAAQVETGDSLLHTVLRSDFTALVTESGEIESSSNVELRCEVKSEGGGGTTILEIVDEGASVQPGDFLIQYDDSALKLALTQQEILVATDETAVIGAESELAKAVQTLDEYKHGLFVTDKETFESELLQAEANLKTAQDSAAHALRMFRKGYVSQLQYEAQEVAVQMAQKGVKVAETKLKVHEEFTYRRMVSQYEADIKKQEAALRAAKHTIKLSQQRRDEILEQIQKCHVLAPTAGQVVYANDFERQQRLVIEEGAQVREGQVVIRLPNPQEMQVRARINDSKIKQVKVDDSVDIELDVNPDLPVRGVVTKINSFPYPREWYGGPIEYGIEIRILDPPPGLTPGQRAKAKILVEQLRDVLQVPIQSVLERSGSHYCLVRDAQGTWLTRKVSIGSNNGSFVVVREGLDEGEQVALNPELYWEQLVTGQATGDERRTDDGPAGP